MVSDGNTLLVCGTKPTPLATSSCAVQAGDVLARGACTVPVADLDQAEHRLEQRRLAGTVRTDDADQLALLERPGRSR